MTEGFPAAGWLARPLFLCLVSAGLERRFVFELLQSARRESGVGAGVGLVARSVIGGIPSPIVFFSRDFTVIFIGRIFD